MYWDQLTHQQIDKIDRSTPVILLVSATEQHGPHLPLATDRMIGEHFLKKLNDKQPDSILVLPSVSVGCSEHHMDFSGTLSIQHSTFLSQVTDIFNSVIRYGFTNLILFNSHGGNQAIGQSWVEIFGNRHPECQISMMTWWKIAHEALLDITETAPGGTGHAGEFETSLMMLIAPELVHTDHIQPKANAETHEWAKGSLLTGPRASLYRTMKEMTPNGVLGEPAVASVEKGERITEVVLGALEGLVKDLGS